MRDSSYKKMYNNCILTLKFKAVKRKGYLKLYVGTKKPQGLAYIIEIMTLSTWLYTYMR